MTALAFIFFVGLGYLLGSLCSAVLISRIFNLPDPRVAGSKNPGATNVLRLAGKKYAAMVLVADMLKGLFPVLLAQLANAGPVISSFTGLAAVFGHMYPVFFGFRGGKGVATAIGVFFGLHIILGVLVIATWLLVAKFTRYASLASLVTIVLAPIYTLFTAHGLQSFPPLFFIALFVFYKHRNNITRLIDGDEPEIQLKSNTLQDEVDAVLSEQEVEQTLFPNDDETETLPPSVEKDNEDKSP